MITLALLTDHNALYRDQLLNAGLAGISLVEHPAEAEIWLADPDQAAEALRQLPPPAWLASTYAGVNPLLDPALPRGYPLTHIKGVFGPLMAEYVMGQLLSLYRDLPRLRAQQQARQWQPFGYDTLTGKTLLVLGTGDIGREVARVAAALGMRPIGISRSGSPAPHFVRVYPVSQLHAALAQAQVVVGVLPDTPATRGLMDDAALAALPREAVLVNVGRGTLVEEETLLAALDCGQLRHAVLDVFPQEPLAPEHPFWGHPAVTLTPHVAATSFPQQIWQQFIDNLRRYLAGEPLQHRFDWERGY